MADRFLTATGEPNYPLQAFRTVGSKLQTLEGGGGGSAKGGQAVQQATAPEKPPQASKTPTTDVFRQNNTPSAAARAGMGATPSDTMLTGPSGVDNSTLNLGKNTLLGQ